MVDRLTLCLFRRHVLGCPRNHSALGQTRVVDRAGKAEIGQLDPFHAVFEQDIRGFDVPMHQTLRVGRGQPLCGLHPDSQDFLGPKGPFFVNPFLKRYACDVRHDEIGKPVPGRDRMDRDDVVVDDSRSGSRLTGKPAPRRGARCQLWGEDLDGHGAAKCRIKRFQHHTEAAAADDFADFIRGQTPQRARRGRWFEKCQGSAELRPQLIKRRRCMVGHRSRRKSTGRSVACRQVAQLAPKSTAGGESFQRARQSAQESRCCVKAAWSCSES